MMHKAWSSIEEMPNYFSRSSIKFQCHTGQKIADCDPNWAFPNCNSILISPMDLKWCTKVDVLLKRCPIVLRGHPSNFKATQAEKWTTWLLGRSHLSNPSFAICKALICERKTNKHGPFWNTSSNHLESRFVFIIHYRLLNIGPVADRSFIGNTTYIIHDNSAC